MLLALSMMDGEIYRRVISALSVFYWLAALVVLLVRPGEWGLRYLRHGVWVMSGLSFVVIEVA